jgi:inorganic pyrophosphatase
MIAPGALVILTPVVVGVLFGTRTLAGLLSGALVSGVQMAVSMSNTGGAWDNAKKYVEVSALNPRRHEVRRDERRGVRTTTEHSAVVW